MADRAWPTSASTPFIRSRYDPLVKGVDLGRDENYRSNEKTIIYIHVSFFKIIFTKRLYWILSLILLRQQNYIKFPRDYFRIICCDLGEGFPKKKMKRGERIGYDKSVNLIRGTRSWGGLEGTRRWGEARVNRVGESTRATTARERRNARQGRGTGLAVGGHGLFAFRDHEAVVSLPWKLSSRMELDALRPPTYLSFPFNLFPSPPPSYVFTKPRKKHESRWKKRKEWFIDTIVLCK